MYLNDVTKKFTTIEGAPKILKQSAATALVDGGNLLGKSYDLSF